MTAPRVSSTDPMTSLRALFARGDVQDVYIAEAVSGGGGIAITASGRDGKGGVARVKTEADILASGKPEREVLAEMIEQLHADFDTRSSR